MESTNWFDTIYEAKHGKEQGLIAKLKEHTTQNKEMRRQRQELDRKLKLEALAVEQTAYIKEREKILLQEAKERGKEAAQKGKAISAKRAFNLITDGTKKILKSAENYEYDPWAGGENLIGGKNGKKERLF